MFRCLLCFIFCPPIISVRLSFPLSPLIFALAQAPSLLSASSSPSRNLNLYSTLTSGKISFVSKGQGDPPLQLVSAQLLIGASQHCPLRTRLVHCTRTALNVGWVDRVASLRKNSSLIHISSVSAKHCLLLFLDWVTPSSMENYRGSIVQSVLLSAPAWRMEIWPRMKKPITPCSGKVYARMKAQGCWKGCFSTFCPRQLISIQTIYGVSWLTVK